MEKLSFEPGVKGRSDGWCKWWWRRWWTDILCLRKNVVSNFLR